MGSVGNQSFTGYEHIFIDGGSTDGSRELVEANARRFSYWVSEKDNGIYDAINKGIRQAKGQYCMFLNSGDFLIHDDILQNAFRIIQKEELDIYYGDVLLEEPGGEKWTQTHAPVMDLHFLQERTLNHQASFIKRSLFEELGYYKEQYGLAADYAFYLQAFLKGKTFYYINEVMVHYKRDGISSRQMETYMQQMQQIWNNMVPAPVAQLLEENKQLRKDEGKRLVKWGKKIDTIYRKLRK